MIPVAVAVLLPALVTVVTAFLLGASLAGRGHGGRQQAVGRQQAGGRHQAEAYGGGDVHAGLEPQLQRPAEAPLPSPERVVVMLAAGVFLALVLPVLSLAASLVPRLLPDLQQSQSETVLVIVPVALVVAPAALGLSYLLQSATTATASPPTARDSGSPGGSTP